MDSIPRFPPVHLLIICLHLNMQLLVLTVRSDFPVNSKLPHEIQYKVANEFKESFQGSLKAFFTFPKNHFTFQTQILLLFSMFYVTAKKFP